MRFYIRYGSPPSPDRYGRVTQKDLSLRFTFVIREDQQSVLRIRDLLDLLSQRVNAELGLHEQHEDSVKIPFALINGQFTLSGDDLVSDALRDNDELVLPDSIMVMNLENPLLNKDDIWLSVERQDDKDGVSKWARVGSHIRGKAFIQLGTGNRVRKLNSVSAADVRAFLRTGNSSQVVDRVQDTKNNWFIEAQLIRCGDSKVSALRLSIKVGSQRQTWSEQVELQEEHGVRLAKGQVSHVSGNDAEEEGPDESIDYNQKLAAESELEPKRNGNTDDIVDKSLGKTVWRHDSSGESQIDMTLSSLSDENLTHFVEANSFLDRNPDGSWDQTFTIPALTFVNKGSNNASVVSIRMQYKEEEGGSWCDASKTLMGAQFGRGQYSWFEEGDNSLNLAAGTSAAFVVRGIFRQRQGSPGNDNFTRRRAATHLPQPLPLRVILTDNTEKERSLIVEQLNQPLGLPTAEQRAKSWSVKSGQLDGFVYIDDHEATERLFTALYRDVDSRGDPAVILRFSHGTYFTYNRKVIKNLEFQAEEDDVTEREMPNMCKKLSNGHEWKTTLLFDRENKFKLYGVRFYVGTKDGSVEQTFVMPKLELESSNK